MNEQSQELRSFEQVFKEDLQKIIQEDDLALDKFEVLSKSMYRHTRCIDSIKIF